MNSKKEALIHVYGYIGKAKSWFLKYQHIVRFLLYENMNFSQKLKKNHSIKLNFPPFLKKTACSDFKNHDFTSPMYPCISATFSEFISKMNIRIQTNSGIEYYPDKIFCFSPYRKSVAVSQKWVKHGYHKFWFERSLAIFQTSFKQFKFGAIQSVETFNVAFTTSFWEVSFQ